MNEISNTALIVLAAFATLGMLSLAVIVTVAVYLHIQNGLHAKYRGLVKQIEDTSHNMITMLNVQDAQNAEFRWACNNLCSVAKNRVWLSEGELKVQLRKQREFFKHLDTCKII